MSSGRVPLYRKAPTLTEEMHYKLMRLLEGARWFHSSNAQINPGDTVVVPLNAEHIPALPLWQAITQILYNVAIATAAVHAL